MKRKISLPIFFFIAGIIFTGTVITRATQEAYRSRKIEKEIEALKQEAQRVQNENDIIRKQIEYYNTPQFVEKVSKDKISKQKPDENVVMVNQKDVEQEPQAADTQKENSQTESEIPEYVKWWNFFFKYN